MISGLPKKVGKRLADRFVIKLHGRQMHVQAPNSQLRLNLVTSWNKRCGIATYSKFLAAELKKNVKVYVTELPQKNGYNPVFKFLGCSAGQSLDLVHIQFEYGVFPSIKVGKMNLTAFAALPFYLGLASGNRRVITTLHEPRRTIMASGRRGINYTKLLDKIIFNVSDLIIVHTHESKNLMKTVYGVSESKLRVVPHGSLQRPKFLDKEECKRKLGLEGKVVMTILGFVTSKKGHDLVIPLLPQINRNVQLVVAGGPQNSKDEKYLKKLKKLAEQHGCADRVTFTGYLSDLTEVLNATDLALLPYRFVTDSGVLHLLVAYRVPTIASDLEAFREVYNEYGCLELFSVEDPRTLLSKIQLLLSNLKYGGLLKSKCVDMWYATKWSSVAQKHMELYREVLSKR
jgi:glycosyltransferase involved in cell wall biosynthesis